MEQTVVVETAELSPLPERIKPWTEEEMQAEVAAIMKQYKKLEKREAKKAEQQAKEAALWTTVGKKKKKK